MKNLNELKEKKRKTTKQIHKLQRKANIYNDMEEYQLFDNVLTKIFLLAQHKQKIEEQIQYFKEIEYLQNVLKNQVESNKKIGGRTAKEIAIERLIIIGGI